MESDIVKKLYQCGVPEIVEKIFSYLNYGDIKNAILASRIWDAILTKSEVNVWKCLWKRNIDQSLAWNLLYKRAVSQGSYHLQTDPDWSFQEACHFIGEAHQKLLLNWQQGIYKENRQDIRGLASLHWCEISTDKVVRTVGDHCGIMRIQSRWRLDESPKEFDITGRGQHTPQFEISEPYLVAVTLNHCVCVWDLEKNQKVHEFYPEEYLDNWPLKNLQVKTNGEFLITCALYGHRETSDYQTLLTTRQMSGSDGLQKEKFSIVNNLQIPNFGFNSIYLEDQRIVMFNDDWSTFIIVSIKPFRLIRRATILPLTNPLHPCDDDPFRFSFGVKPYCAKYWNGWLLQNENGDTLKITNIDTGETLQHQHDYKGRLFDYAFVNSKFVTFWHDKKNLTFDVWNFCGQPHSEDKIHLIYSFQRPPHWDLENHDLFNWKVIIDDIQIWVFLQYRGCRIGDWDFLRRTIFTLDFAE